MTDQPHLDDEALSAVLDGEGTVDEAAHADACAACSERLRVLGDASLLVRSPVPPPADAERDAMVAGVLAATTATVVPLRRRRVVPAWLAAAAVVAVVAIGAVVLAGRDGGSSGSNDFAAERTTAGADSSAGRAPAPNAAVAGPVDGGDLGEVQVTGLRSTIDAALAASRDAAKDSAGTSAGVAAIDCEDAVRSGNPDLGVLVYRARGTLDGEAVAILAFDTGGRRWVYVVAGDCAIRNQTTYAVPAAP